MKKEKCPCNNKRTYMECCGMILEGNQTATTAEKLMRSRYSAHVKDKIDYIINTIHSSTRKNTNRNTIEQWARQTSWQGLEILETTRGGANDLVGRVIFKAHYKLNGQMKFHHEDSVFKKEDGVWYYVDGTTPKTQPKRSLKLGRNSPCHCGSGKKFKKCCFKK
ncbi:MAG: YchJ family protein [Saprospiraceae bacterium]|nr:YchJ family protein [Saprospiraceae bacterium]